MFGYHAQISKGYYKAFKEAIDENINYIQIFFKPPKSGTTSRCNIDEKSNINKTRKLIIYNNIILSSHAIYTTSISKPNSHNQIDNLINDLECGYSLAKNNYLGTVVHVGSGTIKDVRDNIKYGITKIKELEKKLNVDLKCKFIIENQTGGNKLFQRIHHFKEYFDGLTLEEIKYTGICIDICHLYVVYEGQTYKDLFKKIKNNIGWENVTLIHFNDCAKKYVDHHADIFEGVISHKELKYAAKYLSKLNIPMILETKGDIVPIEKQISKLLKIIKKDETKSKTEKKK